MKIMKIFKISQVALTSAACVNIIRYDIPDSGKKRLETKLKRIILHEDYIMAENDALNATAEKTAENLYLQGVALEFQSDMIGASLFYNEDLLLDPENEIIQEAVNRIEKATSVAKKSV